jgi:flagellar hook-length control protein FliK
MDMEGLVGMDYARGAVQSERALAKQLVADEYQPPTTRQQLLNRKEALTRELGNVDAALNALDAHPELERFTETIKRAMR